VPSEVSRNAPLRVPTRTRTPLMGACLSERIEAPLFEHAGDRPRLPAAGEERHRPGSLYSRPGFPSRAGGGAGPQSVQSLRARGLVHVRLLNALRIASAARGRRVHGRGSGAPRVSHRRRRPGRGEAHGEGRHRALALGGRAAEGEGLSVSVNRSWGDLLASRRFG
jgi:hypothetical protein